MADITSGASGSSSVSGVVSTLAVINPMYTGIYQFSAQDLPGVVAANNFLSLFNPVASGVNVIVIGGVVSSYLITGATNVRVSMQVARITAASLGTLQGAAAIAKGITAYPAAMAEVRTANPTVTAGAAITSVPPPIAGTFAMRSVLNVAAEASPLLLVPGEGIVARTSAGDTDQTWCVQVQWAEMAP